MESTPRSVPISASIQYRSGMWNRNMQYVIWSSGVTLRRLGRYMTWSQCWSHYSKMLLSIWKWNKKWGLPCKIPQKWHQHFSSFSAGWQRLFDILLYSWFECCKEDIDSHLLIYFFIFRYFRILGETFFFWCHTNPGKSNR